MADDPSLLTKTVAQVEAEVQGHGRKLDDACDSITIVMDMLESFVTRDELEQHRPLPAAGAATDGDVSQQNSHHGHPILICSLSFCKTILCLTALTD